MKKLSRYLLLLFVVTSCKNEVNLSFQEEVFTPETKAIVEIVYPKLSGNTPLEEKINNTIEATIAQSIVDTKNVSIEDAVKYFEEEFSTFIKQFEEPDLQWEATVDGEVTYQSEAIISVALNTYLNKGGAHGNSYIQFLNFNTENGMLLSQADFIKKDEGFTSLVKNHFSRALEERNDADNNLNDVVFKLPEQIGMSDDGLIFLYNTYELSSIARGLLEFTIPLDEVKSFLRVH